jgi:autotransporter-associated beta strand protein
MRTHTALTTLVLLTLLSTSMSLTAGAQTAADFQTAEYYRGGGLDLIRAADAYALGYTGKGVAVGIIDFPTNFTNPELAKKTGSYDVEGVGTFNWEQLLHGTHVTGIAVASKDDTGMHGVAFDAAAITRRAMKTIDPNGTFDVRSDLFDPYLQTSLAGVKVLNNSWGGATLEDLIKNDKNKEKYAQLFSDPETAESNFSHLASEYKQLDQACAGDKLLVFAAGNAGHPFPIIDALASRFGKHTPYNMLTVTAADNYSLTANSDGSISGQTALTFFSELAGFVEDSTLAAPGWQILSANANYAKDGKADIFMSGTSMAAPYVTGASALVQQAFPYLNAKQLGDVLLSTANNKLTLTDYQVQMVAENNRVIGFNLMFTGAPPEQPLTQEELKQLAKAAYKDYYLGSSGLYTKADWDARVDRYVASKGDRGVQAYYYTGLQELVGQGVLDVSKAVRGPGALNARRLTKDNISADYTVAGTKTSQALYPMDTAGYNSCWSNAIKEIKAGLMAPDSSEADLRARWLYYDTNWISNAQANAGMRTVTSDYVNYFNKGVTDSGLQGLSVGLYKTGAGILRLTGANTYQGSSIAAGGILAVDGSVAGDAYSTGSGILAGTGTIGGDVYNKGTLQPGSYAVNSVSDTNPAFSLGTLTVQGNLNSTGTVQVAVQGTTNSKLEVKGKSNLTGSSLSLAGSLSLPLVNHQYNYLTSQNGITGNVTTTDPSPYLTLAGTVQGNNAYFAANQKQTLGNLPGQTASEKSVGGALNKRLLEQVNANPDSNTAQTLNAMLYQSDAASRHLMKQVTSEARAQLLQESPLSHLTNESIYDRLDTVDFSGLVAAEAALPHLTSAQGNKNLVGAAKTANQNSVAEKNSANQNSASVSTSTPVTLDANNNLWLKLFKGYETFNYADELKDHSFGGAIGYDKALNLTTRVGGLFSYGITNYSTDNISGDSHDWRVGAYVDHKNGNWDYQGLLTYGRNHYDLDRDILGGKLNSDYKAKVWDVEAKAKYLIPSTARKTWQFTPYGKLSYTHSSQDAYGETGGSVFAQNMDSTSHNSTRGEIGVEFKRAYDKNGGFGGSVGYKRVISGLNPELNGTFVGDSNNFTISTDNDRNFVTYSANVHGKLAKNWTGQAELRGEASQNTHKEIISVAAKYSF